MKKEFIPYEQALALKELGFDEPCFAFYLAGNVRYKEYKDSQNKNSAFYNNTVCSAPLYQQAFRFFMEKYNIRGFIGFRPNIKKFGIHVYDMSLSGMEYAKQRTMEAYDKDPICGTYAEAELACIIKLIQIAKSR
jgi:hypothetical protein